MDKNKNFYFLEMNTRLQVEHPVTEFITGLDLVKEQLSIANGEKLSIQQKDIKLLGHSIECRVYAEDALNDFLPSTGKIFNYKTPSGPGVRLDSGFDLGSEISIYYDPLISKLITWGCDRSNAVQRMKRALNEYKIAGVTTNINFLSEILKHSAFTGGSFDINFVENIFLKEKKNSNANNDGLMNAAALFSVLMKSGRLSESKKVSLNHKSTWREQLYE
jgi:acetyl/propionyl-CoA carboxylase alpha subunit